MATATHDLAARESVRTGSPPRAASSYATPILLPQGEKHVIGWLIIFATATFTSGFWGSSAHEPGAMLASGIFGSLFLLTLGAKAVRGPVC